MKKTLVKKITRKDKLTLLSGSAAKVAVDTVAFATGLLVADAVFKATPGGVKTKAAVALVGGATVTATVSELGTLIRHKAWEKVSGNNPEETGGYK